MRTNLISSEPSGLPCEEAFPDLLGEPKPITVLQDTIVGLFDLHAFDMALNICFLCHGGVDLAEKLIFWAHR